MKAGNKILYWILPLIGTIAVLAVSVLALVYGSMASRAKTQAIFGGASGLDIVAEPTRVEAYRLNRLPEGAAPGDVAPWEYPVAAGPVNVPAEVASELSAVLVAPESYLWDAVKACGDPIYGVKLSFLRDSKEVDVYLCFWCDVLAVVRDGRIVGSEDFDNARPVLVRALKGLFPGDKVIQSLPSGG